MNIKYIYFGIKLNLNDYLINKWLIDMVLIHPVDS